MVGWYRHLKENWRTSIWLASGCLFVVAMSLWSVSQGISRWIYPYSIDYGEGLAKVIAARFSTLNLAHLYPPTDATNLVPAAYTPVYYGLCALLMDAHIPAYTAGRLIALASVFGICVLIYLAVLRGGQDRWMSLIASGSFLMWQPVYDWIGYMRADFTAIFFSVLGLYLLEHRPKTHIFWIAACFIVALMTKQNMVIAPVVAFIVLARNERWRAGAFAQFYGWVLGAIFLTIELWTGGRFLEQIVGSVQAPINLDNSQHLTQVFLTQHGVVCGLALWGALVLWRERRFTWGMYFILALLFGGWSIGKDGSAANYFIEPAAAGTMCLGIALAKLRNQRPVEAGVLAVALLMVQLVSWVPNNEAKTTQDSWRMQAVNTSNRRALEEIVNRCPTDVLADDPGIVTDSDKPLTIASFEYKLYYQSGAMDDQPLAHELQDGKYGLAVLSFPVQQNGTYFRFTSQTMQAVYDHFHLIGVINNTPGQKFIYANNMLPASVETFIRLTLPPSQPQG